MRKVFSEKGHCSPTVKTRKLTLPSTLRWVLLNNISFEGCPQFHLKKKKKDRGGKMFVYYYFSWLHCFSFFLTFFCGFVTFPLTFVPRWRKWKLLRESAGGWESKVFLWFCEENYAGFLLVSLARFILSCPFSYALEYFFPLNQFVIKDIFWC